MTDFQKPRRLRPGDTVAVLSLSWGGPSVYPHVFDLGLSNLQDLLDVTIREYPTTRMAASELHDNPCRRAEDLNAAFADPEICAVIASIGGDDSVRLLPYLDAQVIARNPKILMGYSDTTTLLTYANQLGLVTFNGPSIMAGFAQTNTLPEAFTAHVRQMLMEPSAPYPYAAYPQRVVKCQRWEAPGGYAAELEYAHNDGWRWLQGESVVQGQLFGGCIQVLEFLKSTRWWPAPEFWQGKILFMETSDEKPTPSQVKYMLRNYGMQGIFDQITGLLFARPEQYALEERETLFQVIVSVVAGEFGRADLPIIAEMDFGHEAPQTILPLGVMAEMDCARRTFRLVETCVL
jgi:muramoyltetrapeptide carboxypeptidase LdcA involved in peptidoglycan recycling